MMKEEFERLSGVYVTPDLYREIERAYYAFEGDKVAFCKAYRADEGGMAGAIVRRCFERQFRRAHPGRGAARPVLIRRVNMYDGAELCEYGPARAV